MIKYKKYNKDIKILIEVLKYEKCDHLSTKNVI